MHYSWLRVFYDFIFDPQMSLRSRIKRKVAGKEEHHFFGIGAFGRRANCVDLTLEKPLAATSYVYQRGVQVATLNFQPSRNLSEFAARLVSRRRRQQQQKAEISVISSLLPLLHT